MRNLLIAALCLIPVLTRPAAGTETEFSVTEDGRFRVETTLLYERDMGGKLVGQQISPDHRHIAVVVEKGGREAAWSDQFSLSPYFEQLVGLFFSPDGERLAVLGTGRSGEQVVLVDGEEVGRFGWILNNEILFTDDSRHFAFAVGAAGETDAITGIVIDGIVHSTYSSLQSLDKRSPNKILCVDGGRVIYFARRGEDYFMVTDGVEGPAFDQTGFGPAISEDGRHAAYGGMKDAQWYVVADSTLHGPFPEVSDIHYPPGATEPSYVVTWPDSARLFVDHEAVAGEYKLVKSPAFDEDGTLRCFWAVIDGKVVVVAGGKPDRALAAEHYSVSTPWMSDCGHHYVYEMVFDSDFRQKAFVVDGKLLSRTECTGNYKIHFSDDGGHFATSCYSRDPRRTVVMIDDVRGPYEGLWIDPVTFTEDGSRWATRVIPDKGSAYLLVDGEKWNRDGDVGPVSMTPDGEHLAYAVSNAKGDKQYLVIDETRFATYTSVGPKDIRFDSDGGVVYYPRIKDKQLFRVVVRSAMQD